MFQFQLVPFAFTLILGNPYCDPILIVKPIVEKLVELYIIYVPFLVNH